MSATPLHRTTPPSLETLFRPKGIAVLGAGDNPKEPGYQILHSLLSSGYPGHLAAIDSAAEPIWGIQSYPNLQSVPGPVEMLISTIPAEMTPHVVEAIRERVARRHDLRTVVAVGRGFAETGTSEGLDYQRLLTNVCRESGVRLLGPNCVGVIDNHHKLNATFLSGVYRQAGGISFVSQSGGMAVWLAKAFASFPQPAGLNKLVHVGNMADLDLAETLEYLGNDPSTRVIGLYLEGDPDFAALSAATHHAGELKPIVCLRAGRSHASREAAATHTGSTLKPEPVHEMDLRQLGLIEASRMDLFAATLCALDRLPLPLDRRIAVLTNAGGAGVYTLDLLAEHGLEPAPFSRATQAMLEVILPSTANIGTPDGYVDTTGGIEPDQMAQAVAVVLRDPNIDAVIQIFAPTKGASGEEMAHELAMLMPALKRHSLEKPLFPILVAGDAMLPARRIMEEHGMPTFATPDEAVAALAAMIQFSTGPERL